MQNLQLRSQLTTFMGRDEELARLAERFESGSRLVTLFGPPGIGKTRLALRYAGRSGREVRTCDLSSAEHLGDACISLAWALDVSLESLEPAVQMESLGRALSAHDDLLLVFDNCEHLAAELAKAVATFAAVANGVAFLVTSRELLGLPFEVAFEVGPLRIPRDALDVDADASRLFVDRARLVDVTLDPTGAHAASICELVQRLDGVPLALELAAGCLDVLGLVDLLARLSTRLDDLDGGGRVYPDRHRTLRAAIDSSWTLLAPCEQHALATCAAFHGGFSLAATEAIVDLSGFPSAPSAARVVASLRRKSLIRAFDASAMKGIRRLGLYESIRVYAEERLVASGRRDDVAHRHASYYTRVAAQSCDPRASNATETDRALYSEVANLRGAYEHCLSSSPPNVAGALTIAIALEPALHTFGALCPLVELLDAPLRLLDRTVSTSLVARARIARACARQFAAPGEAVRVELEEALELARRAGDRVAEGRALASIARGVAGEAPAASLPFYERAAEVLAGVGDRRRQALTLLNRAAADRACGDFEGARDHLASAAVCAVAAGDLAAQAHVSLGLGTLHFVSGRLDEAEAELRRGAALAAEAGSFRAEAQAASCLAPLLQERGRWDDARAAYERAHDGFRRVDDALSTRRVAWGLAMLHHEVGELELARQRYEEALDEACRSGSTSTLALRVALAAVMADLDVVDDARDVLACETASEELEAGPVRFSLLEGHIELARARGALAGGDTDTAARLRSSAAARLERARVANDVAVRFARRLLDRALGRLAGAPARAHAERRLLVGPHGRWFIDSAGERVDIGGQRVLRLLLLALAHHRRKAGATLGLSTAELLAAGWPGERVSNAAGDARVRVSLSRLRALGLRDFIVRVDGGHALDRDVIVVLEAE